MRIPSGTTNRYIYFVAVDSTDLKTRETGLSSFTVYGSLNGGASSLWTTPTVNETDTTNMPGVYELLLDEQTTLTAGNDTEELCLHITQASMAPVTRVVEIYRPKFTEGQTGTMASNRVNADAVAISGTTTPADVLEDIYTNAVTTSSVNDGSPSASSFITNLAEASNDHYNGMVLVFTSGNLKGQARSISDYDGGASTITVGTAFTEAPANSDTFKIIGRIE